MPLYLKDGEPLTQQLDAAVAAAAARGVTIRALLITHPDNPTGALLRSTAVARGVLLLLRPALRCYRTHPG